jgi:predicted  nucleic acid-binding Zn-ribbon protein
MNPTKVRTATLDAAAAVGLLRRAHEASGKLAPLDTPMTDVELRQRAEIIDRVVRARAKLERLRNRAIDLERALDRYKARRRETP